MRILLVGALLCIWANTEGQSLLFNEAMAENSFYPSDNGVEYPFVEFINDSTEVIRLSDYYLTSDSLDLKAWVLPSIELQPDSIFLLWLSGNGGANHSDVQIDLSADYLYLTNGSRILDDVPIKCMVKNQSYGRRGGFPGEKVYFIDREDITLGKPNVDPGPWVKVQGKASFQVGDAGYYGCVVYNDKLWILDYETLEADGSAWIDLIQVWSSPDGFNWELINANPPYKHAAMVAVFNGYMWAFDGRAFRSKDGIVWEQVSSDTPDSERVVEFNNSLWILQRESIYRSHDGIAWEKVVDQVPWGNRDWPAFLKHNGKLWMFGGNANYKTGNDIYYTDVWSSDDGVNWEMVNESAPWRGTIWFTYASYDGRIWLIEGGWNYWDRMNPFNGNGNEVWYSEDGVDWSKSAAPTNWFNRHAQFTWVFKDELWIGAGYAGGGTHHLYNDIWRYSRKPSPIFASPEITIAYGTEISLLGGQVQPGGFPFAYSLEDPTVATVNGDTLTATQAGETRLLLSHKGDDFYRQAEAEIKVVVNKRDLFVRPADTEMIFGETAPEIELEYSGFVFGEDKTVLDVQPSAVSPVKRFSPVGTYLTTAAGGSDDNYNYVFQNGELIIHPSESFTNVFPNPVRHTMQIVFSSMLVGPIVIELFSSTGVRVGYHVERNFQVGEFDLSTLDAGVYILRIHSENGTSVTKVVKM